LEEITKEVEKVNPAVVVVDSFRTMVQQPKSDMDLQSFIQRLALYLASWQATTFLIGEYAEEELRDNPIFTVADGLFWLRQTTERNSIVR
jgi:circadian clock protein KaiC